MTYVKRAAQEVSLHDKAVQAIAKVRLPYPDEKNPNLKTYTNEPTQTMGIKNGDHSVYPDMVVVDTQRNVTVIIGEVETDSTVYQYEVQQWKEYSSLSVAFYLYVPAGTENTARQLLASNSVKISGLRAYSFDGNGNVQVADVAI